MALDVCYRLAFAVGNHSAHPVDVQKGSCETVAEVMDAEAEGEDEIHPSKKRKSGGMSSYTRPASGRARES